MTRLARDLALERAEQIRRGEVRPACSTGLKKLDAVIGGLGPFLHIVGGATGGGKSTLLLNLATATSGVADGRVPYLWSGEDPVSLTCDRILSALCGVPAERLGSGSASKEEGDRAYEAARRVGAWYLDDKPGTAREVLIRVMGVREKVSMFAGDYVQVYLPADPRTPEDSRDHIVEVVRTHARFSAAYGLPVVLGSQFTKFAQTRLDQATAEAPFAPQLSDLHGSGDLMKIAKCVLLVHAEGQDFNCYVAKQNFGAGRGKVVRMRWDPAISTIFGG